MSESRTCGNCGVYHTCCPNTALKIVSNYGCMSWQPIPVETTDAPEPKDGMHTNGRNRSWTSDGEVTYLHEAIAKRDDLIRRMADELRTYPATNLRHMKIRLNLSDEANELMGVK